MPAELALSGTFAHDPPSFGAGNSGLPSAASIRASRLNCNHALLQSKPLTVLTGADMGKNLVLRSKLDAVLVRAASASIQP